jgi:hypothetical protein
MQPLLYALYRIPTCAILILGATLRQSIFVQLHLDRLPILSSMLASIVSQRKVRSSTTQFRSTTPTSGSRRSARAAVCAKRFELSAVEFGTGGARHVDERGQLAVEIVELDVVSGRGRTRPRRPSSDVSKSSRSGRTRPHSRTFLQGKV